MHSFKGASRMDIWLIKDKDYNASKNRIERLYCVVLGLRANMPCKHTSKRNKKHSVYPYLLRDFTVDTFLIGVYLIQWTLNGW